MGGFHSVDFSDLKMRSKGIDGKYLEIPTYHLSCKSLKTSDWSKQDIGGIIIYQSFENSSIRIRPGYVFVHAVS